MTTCFKGRHYATVFQFKRNIPTSGKDLGNAKKDRFLLSVEGLDQVNFGTKTVQECLVSVVAGTWNPPRLISK